MDGHLCFLEREKKNFPWETVCGFINPVKVNTFFSFLNVS